MSLHTTIHADSRADVATIADKIVRSAAQKIFLVVGDDARIAFHVLNFQLLSREAESADKTLVIVSPSIRVQALATKAGLLVQESRGISVMPDDARETRTGDDAISVVHLGVRRVADIIPRHSRNQDVESAILMRTAEVSRQEDMRDKERISKAPVRPLDRQAAQTHRKGHQKETEGANAAAEEAEIMQDILRRETRVQDSVWRKFLHARKKSSPSAFQEEEEYFPAAKKSTDERSSQSHHARRLRLGTRLAEVFGGRQGRKPSFPPSGLTRKRSVHFPFLWGSFAVATLFIGIFVASTVLPTVSIAIIPHTQKQILQIPIHVDTLTSEIDATHHLIPGQIIQETAENSQTFTASTKQNVQMFASGQIRVFNQYSSAPQALVQNTRFVSQNGLLFHTTQSVVIPGAEIQNGQIIASSLAVDVIAAEVGDKYNINPSTFSIPGFQGTPKFTAFYGKSESPMKGGFSGTATIVSDADIARAKDALSKMGNNQALDKLKTHVPSGFVLAGDAIDQEAPSITLTAKSGDRADSFSGVIQNSVRTIIFRQSDIKTIVDSYLKNEYKSDPSTVALPQANIRYSVQTKDFDKGKFDLTLQVDQIFATNIDTQTIGTMTRGMSDINVRSYLSSYPGIDRANIIFWPFWVHNVPDNQERISLRVQYPS